MLFSSSLHKLELKKKYCIWHLSWKCQTEVPPSLPPSLPLSLPLSLSPSLCTWRFCCIWVWSFLSVLSSDGITFPDPLRHHYLRNPTLRQISRFFSRFLQILSSLLCRSILGLWPDWRRVSHRGGSDERRGGTGRIMQNVALLSELMVSVRHFIYDTNKTISVSDTVQTNNYIQYRGTDTVMRD